MTPPELDDLMLQEVRRHAPANRRHCYIEAESAWNTLAIINRDEVGYVRTLSPDVTLQLIEVRGGEEGDGQSPFYVIVRVLDELNQTSQYFRRNGYYASYEGGFLDGATEEVFPKQVEVTVYEKV